MLAHLLRYIRDNKALFLKYYADIKYALLSELPRQSNIESNSQLISFSDSSWKYCPENGRSTGAYIIFYQGGKIDHVTPVPGPVAK